MPLLKSKQRVLINKITQSRVAVCRLVPCTIRTTILRENTSYRWTDEVLHHFRPSHRGEGTRARNGKLRGFTTPVFQKSSFLLLLRPSIRMFQLMASPTQTLMQTFNYMYHTRQQRVAVIAHKKHPLIPFQLVPLHQRQISVLFCRQYKVSRRKASINSAVRKCITPFKPTTPLTVYSTTPITVPRCNVRNLDHRANPLPSSSASEQLGD